MKKIISTFTILFIIFSANAQIEKGTNAFGANFYLAYGSRTNNISTNSNFSLIVQPDFEHFVTKNLSIGLSLSYAFNKSYQEDNFGTITYKYETNVQNSGVQIQLKKYWFATNKVAFTLTPLLSSVYTDYSSMPTSNNGRLRPYNYNNWTHGVYCKIGAMYFIKQNVAIEAQTNIINYSITTERQNLGNMNTFYLSVVPSSLTLGVKFFFGNAQKETVTD